MIALPRAIPCRLGLLAHSHVFPGSHFRFLSTESKDNNKNSNVETADKPTPQYEKPLYATRDRYQSTVKTSRINREADPETGVKPTPRQRWFLVITFLFRNRGEIPEYVPNSTMQRMHDRLRVVFIVVASCIFFSFTLIMETLMGRKIERDRASGVVVTKMA
uniref:Neur_chan_memb domain-containing protein n=1 Tax=Panagrellus redivivus TaxID=6233 RepID=A0A7E4VQW8_PANRE